jgi:hypothetical protein
MYVDKESRWCRADPCKSLEDDELATFQAMWAILIRAGPARRRDTTYRNYGLPLSPRKSIVAECQ